MDVCFLCCQPFNSEWQRKKRKRLYGGSCAEARRLLEDVSLNSLGLPLATYCQRYESDESIFLCCNCEKKLTDLAKCTQRSHALKGEIEQLLTSVATTVTSGSLAKRPHLDTTETGSCTPEQLSPAGESAVTGAAGSPIVQTPSPRSPCLHYTNKSPAVTVTVQYRRGSKIFKLRTPRRRRAVKQCVRKSLSAMSSFMLQSRKGAGAAMSSLKNMIEREVKGLRKLNKSTMFLGGKESLTDFCWDNVWLELHRYAPTLMDVLSVLVLDPTDNKPMVCLVAAMVLKQRYKHFSIVQRAISLLLYGNGTSKQVYNCLQPLMVCLSYQSTIELVDVLSQDWDKEVRLWSEHWKALTLESHPPRDGGSNLPLLDTEPAAGQLEVSSERTISPRTFSPLATLSDISDSSPFASQELSPSCHGDSMVSDEVRSAGQTWTGFKVVGDNIDRNVRPAYQRMDHRTQSYHHFHSVAIKDRVDLSSASNETPQKRPLDLKSLLLTTNDVNRLKVISKSYCQGL
ncbi:uncharacterized protein LOC134196093 [Corticium candelabrum]|uniref:uncharacterized protein LOC134196093 n=1 Tax=Corticium candelabrum TaxID=121492 RepID=UPI002E25A50D|nr:uncharacterized protein LOC134196093 [Corticium candelabrum]